MHHLRLMEDGEDPRRKRPPGRLDRRPKQSLADQSAAEVASPPPATTEPRVHQPVVTHEERQRAEALFTSCLPRIWKLLNALIRGSSLSTADAEDFSSWAQEHLIRNDYAAVRTAGEHFTDDAYLRVTLVHLLIDFRNASWGRWRPSAVAKRLGRVAIQLEQLIFRDQIPVQHAVQMMVSKEKGYTEKEIRQLVRALPLRLRAHEVDLDQAEQEATAVDAERRLQQEELWLKLARALSNAFANLSLEDQVIARMKFQDGATIPEIARMLRVDGKPLYRRIEKILRVLRESMEREGVKPGDVRDALDLESDDLTGGMQ